MQGFYNKSKKKFARESRFNVMEKTNSRIFAYILRWSLQTNWVQIQNRIRSASPILSFCFTCGIQVYNFLTTFHHKGIMGHDYNGFSIVI